MPLHSHSTLEAVFEPGQTYSTPVLVSGYLAVRVVTPDNWEDAALEVYGQLSRAEPGLAQCMENDSYGVLVPIKTPVLAANQTFLLPGSVLGLAFLVLKRVDGTGADAPALPRQVVTCSVLG